MSINVLITSAGINKLSESNPQGSFIDIRYFVPVYDYRLDRDVCTGIALSAIDYSDIVPEISASPYPDNCEIVWNLPGTFSVDEQYIMSNNYNPYTSAVSTSAFTDSVGIGVNTYAPSNSFVPISDYNFVSGTSATIIPPTAEGEQWTNLGINTQGLKSQELYPANNNTDKTKYWRVNNYYPITDENGYTRGLFKIHLTNSNGKFKFNRLALFAVTVDGNGDETADPPVYFADVFVSNLPIVKSSISDFGFDDFVCDVELEFQGLSGDFRDLIFSTSGDYWSKTTNGLYTGTAVGIGALNEGNDLKAALHLRPLQNDVAYNAMTSADTLRIDTSGAGGDSNFQSINVDEYGRLLVSQNSQGPSDPYLIGGNDGVWLQKGGLYTSAIEGTDAEGLRIGGSIVPKETPTAFNLGNYENKFTNIFVIKANITELSAVNESDTILLESTVLAGYEKNIDLGTSTNPFNNICLSGKGTFEGLSSDNFDIGVYKSLVPRDGFSCDIGSYGNKFVNIWCQNFGVTDIFADDVNSNTASIGKVNSTTVVTQNLSAHNLYTAEGYTSILLENNLYPSSTNTIDIGNSNAKLKTLYAKTIQVDDTVTSALSNTTWLTNEIALKSDLIPVNNNEESLGSGSKKYKNIYGMNLSASNISATNIVVTNLSATSTLSAGNLTNYSGNIQSASATSANITFSGGEASIVSSGTALYYTRVGDNICLTGKIELSGTYDNSIDISGDHIKIELSNFLEFSSIFRDFVWTGRSSIFTNTGIIKVISDSNNNNILRIYTSSTLTDPTIYFQINYKAF